MATITKTRPGILTVTLTELEEDAYDASGAGALEAFVTLWLEERRGPALVARFDALSDDDKAQVMQRLRPARP